MNIEPLLAVTRRLAAPVDLTTMLQEVVAAATEVLEAERGSVWLYDRAAHELVLQVSTGLQPVRVPADTGIVGSCARERQVINVRDCYADPRFNPAMDRKTHYRTRCMLTLPLVDYKDVLVGVLQVLNKKDGVFDEADESLATSLAAQCAVALQRARMIEELVDSEKMRHEIEMAREVQTATLPAAMPAIEGYDVFGMSRPADRTGGDTFDVSRVPAGVVLVLGDATGHGLAPALHITQMHAMLRMAMRLGADIDAAVLHLNNQLGQVMPDDRFITAFIGLLDPESHLLRYHSAGQAPILHFSSDQGECRTYRPTTFPLGAMPAASVREAVKMSFAPGDILVLISDGVYEYANDDKEMFGEKRVAAIVAANRFASARELTDQVLAALAQFAGDVPQEDDITLLFVKRELPTSGRCFVRSFDSIPATVDFRREFFSANGIPDSLAYPVDFTIEELFTNMVKYGNMSREDIRIELRGAGQGIEVVLVDPGADRFDVTEAPDVDVSRGAAERRPGGLGLHLIRRMVDSIMYEYVAPTRTGRTSFRKLAVRDGGPLPRT
jgi:phosphoserine phosphatase RsbU/P